MPGSFVAAGSGADTANSTHHQFKWMRVGSAEEATQLAAWQPWIKTTTLGGILVHWWPDVVACWAEVIQFADDVSGLSIVERPPNAPAAARAVLAACRGITKVATTRPAGATALQREQTRFTEEQTEQITLRAADTRCRAADAACPPWQLLITYGLLAEAGVGSEALLFFYFYDSDVSSTSGWGVLDALRRRAELAGSLELRAGWDLLPAPPPALPHPADSVDSEIAAFSTISLLGDNEYGKAVYRTTASSSAARGAALQAEFEGLLKRPTGDSPEIRRRARSACGVVAPLFADFLGDGSLTTAEVTNAINIVAGAILPSDEAQGARLFLTEGLARLNAAFVPHSAWAGFVEVKDQPLQTKCTMLLSRVGQLGMGGGSGGGADAAAPPAHGAGGAGSGSMSATTGGLVQRAAAQAALGDNAAILHHLEPDLMDPQTKSTVIHEKLFRGCDEDAPDRCSTGLLHAMGWGFIDAGVLNSSWALMKSYSTDEAIGRYLAEYIIRRLACKGLLTDKKAERLAGVSLATLAKALRDTDWSKVDLYNMVLREFDVKLAEDSCGKVPAATPAALVYADPAVNAKCPVIVGAIMEALGMQRSGEGSLRDAFEEGNTRIAGNSNLPASAMAELLKSNQRHWRACLKEAGELYHPCRAGCNVKAELPSRNMRDGASAASRQATTRLLSKLEELSADMHLESHFRSNAAVQGGAGGVSAALALLSGGAAKTRRDDAPPDPTKSRQVDGPDAAAQQTTNRQKNAERQAAYESAGQGKMTGAAGEAVFQFGPSKWDATAAAKAWPGKCVPFHCAETCGKGYGWTACPAQGEPGHEEDGDAHKLDADMPRPSKFNLNGRARREAAGKDSGRGGGKGGKGGKGKGGKGDKRSRGKGSDKPYKSQRK